MDMKTKIKLLADIQAAIDSDSFQASVKTQASGDYLWERIGVFLNSELEKLLSGNGEDSKVEEASVQSAQLLKTLTKINKSEVMDILRRLESKLGGHAQQAPAAPVPQTAKPVAPAPPSDGTEYDEEPEDLDAAFENQVRFEDRAKPSQIRRNPSGRGGWVGA